MSFGKISNPVGTLDDPTQFLSIWITQVIVPAFIAS